MSVFDFRVHVSAEDSLRRAYGSSEVHALRSRTVYGDEAYCGARFLGVTWPRNGTAVNCGRCLGELRAIGRSGC